MTGRPKLIDLLYSIRPRWSSIAGTHTTSSFTCHTTPTNNSNPRAFPVLSDAQPHVHVGCRRCSDVQLYRTALCCSVSADVHQPCETSKWISHQLANAPYRLWSDPIARTIRSAARGVWAGWPRGMKTDSEGSFDHWRFEGIRDRCTCSDRALVVCAACSAGSLQSWVDLWSVVSRMGEERSVLLTIFQCFRDKYILLDLRLTSMAIRAYNHCPIVRVRYGGGLTIGPRDLHACSRRARSTARPRNP
jgi:hypothetical protein